MENNSNWIDILETRPEFDTKVFVWIKGVHEDYLHFGKLKEVIINSMGESFKWDIKNDYLKDKNHNVTHWQPFPNAPNSPKNIENE